MELVEPVREVRVVVEEAGAARLAVPEAALELVAGESGPSRNAATAAVDVVRAVEPPPRLGERRDREPVPGGDHLVVAGRLRPRLAELEEPRPQLGVELAADHAAPVLERRAAGRPGTPSSSVHVYVSPSTPSVSASCDEAKPPPSHGELAQDVVERLLDDLAGSAAPRARASRAGTPRRAGRCRRASSRSAARASARRPSSGGSRRRRGRTCRRAAMPSSVSLGQLALAAAQEKLERRRGRELRRAAQAAPCGS